MTRISRSGTIRFLMLFLGGGIILAVIALSIGRSGAFANKPVPAPPDTTGNARQMLVTACMAEVSEIYGHIATPPGSDSVCTFTYHVEAISLDTAVMKNSAADVEMSMNQGRMSLKSERFSVYRDSSDVFTVIPDTRVIFRSDAVNSASTSALGQDFSWMRDTLIARSTIIDCSGILDSADTRFRRVVMSPDPHAKRYFGVEKMTLLLDLERREVRSIAMIPSSRSTIQKIIWTFSPFVYSTPSPDFLKPVASQFLENGNTLSSKWKGYKVVDNRNVSALMRNR